MRRVLTIWTEMGRGDGVFTAEDDDDERPFERSRELAQPQHSRITKSQSVSFGRQTAEARRERVDV